VVTNNLACDGQIYLLDYADEPDMLCLFVSLMLIGTKLQMQFDINVQYLINELAQQ